ncbi:MAG: glutathione S-transferase N-terminal domain-containing protein [Alphaproteobacteria bacterium]|nr:glutathione S-transferase N-terminal domain-containing protein [Alphaproteobacteria bacterium]
MIHLYTSATGNGRRASVMLEECGLSYTAHKLDLSKGDQKKPDFLAINPAGAIPAIVDEEGPAGRKTALAQSGAIVLYLAEKTGKFLPKDPAKKAETLQWFMQVTTDVAPASSAIFYMGSVAPDKTPGNVKFVEERFIGMLKQCEAKLGKSKYLAGDEVTVADLALIPVIDARKALLEKTAGLDNVKRWAAEMMARPGVKKGLQV